MPKYPTNNHRLQDLDMVWCKLLLISGQFVDNLPYAPHVAIPQRTGDIGWARRPDRVIMCFIALPVACARLFHAILPLLNSTDASEVFSTGLSVRTVNLSRDKRCKQRDEARQAKVRHHDVRTS